LIGQGFTSNNVRVLSPHNTGTGGTKAINVMVREAVDLPSDELVEGDILLITENDYEAPCCPPYETDDDPTVFQGLRPAGR